MSDPILFADDLSFPESPRWYGDTLWLSDVHNFCLLQLNEEGQVVRSWPVPGRPAGLGFTPDGVLLMATALDRKILRIDDDHIEMLADLSHLTTGLLNDMVVAADGTLYVGDTGYDISSGDPACPGRVICRRPDGTAFIAAEDIGFPNGMAITPDGGTLYVAETFSKRISRYSIEFDGRLADRTIHAELEGLVDGICLDAEGSLWAARIQASTFIRIDRGGREIDQVSVAPFWAIACMLGGAQRKTFFMCAAEITDGADGRPARRGMIFTKDVSVPGAGLP
jgi:sugar lactone lactonase YvrE